VPDWPRLAASRHSNSLFHLARARPIVETKRKRLMKYYATRQCMPAHAALPLIRTRENRPFPGGARWTARARARGGGLATSVQRRLHRYPLSERIPRARPFHSLSRAPPSAAVRSYLMYGTPLHRAGRTYVVWYSALTARHFRCGPGPVLGAPHNTWVHCLLPAGDTYSCRA
jgi:hypothetical protein